MKLEKLKRASLHELRVRAGQKVAAFSERLGWSDLVKLPSDDVFASFNDRDARPSFFAGFDSPEKTTAEFKSRMPQAAARLVEKADRICDGKFALLGFTDLNFGDPIDWHFEPTTGKRIPLQHWSKLDYLDAGLAGDKKVTWELNRHQYFATLGQAYWLTGDEKYARVFANHLEQWMDANPPKLGINWASSLEVAFRSMSWLWAFYFFKSSPSLSSETVKRALKFLYLGARHLESYLSTYFSPNTHLTGEALGLFYLGSLLPEFKEAKRWQELGSSILIGQLPVHVQRDGVYFEQSTYYHRYTTDFYLHFLILSRAHGLALPAQVEESLVLLLDHLMYITRPDGTTPFVGDDDGGRLVMLDDRAANDFRGTLAVGSVVFNRGDYKFVAGDAIEQLLWLTGAAGLSLFDSIKAVTPEKTSAGFDSGGYFVMRDGWTSDSNYLLFDCGPHGSLNCGHAHADALSFDLAANGRTMLVDPGTYTYTGSKEGRDWFRSSQAHNTVVLDRESSSVPDGAFSWKTRAECYLQDWITEERFDYVCGAHSGFTRLFPPAVVRRQILFLKGDYWIIRDTMTASSEHQAEIHFHFDSSAHPVLVAGSVRDAESGFKIQCFSGGQWIEEDAWVSHSYGHREPAKAFKFARTFPRGESVYSFLLPSKAGVEWNVTRLPAEEGDEFEVTVGNTRDLVMIRAGEWVWRRFTGGELRETVSPRIKTDVRD
jgi:heparinase II/III-like protein